MSTPTDIITAAYGRSAKNRPDEIATKATELLAVVGRAIKGIYSFAAEINPEFFGKSAVVGFTSGGWPIPADTELVFRLELDDGTEVVKVPRTQRDAETGRPAVYQLGRKLFTAGNASDPTSGNLTFIYSQHGIQPATVDTAFDASWITDFDGFLVEEVALYLIIKDGRSEEFAAVVDARDRWARRFAARLEHEFTNTVFLYGSARNINVPDLIKTYLAGGQPPGAPS